MIRQANESDIKAIEDIFLDAIQWMRQNHIENQWNEENTKWGQLSKEYAITDFYLAEENGVVAACLAITDEDQKYWSDIPKGQALYLHKLAVKRDYAGHGLSTELMNYIKEVAKARGIESVRLDCNYQRRKLRAIYERAGFVYAGKTELVNHCEMALYAWVRE